MFLEQLLVAFVEKFILLFPKKWAFDIKAVFFYFEAQDRITKWHRTELEKRDSGFATLQANLKLIAARGRARE